MKRLLEEHEYASLYDRRSTKLSIGDKVGVLTGVIGEYKSYSVTDGTIIDIDAENRIYLIKLDATDIAIKFNKKSSQVKYGRVTKYETSIIKY
jgi:hypothetical protein